MAEAELDKHTTLVTDLTRRIDELQVKADEAARLKDQVDEYVFYLDHRLTLALIIHRYRHAADRLQKTENVMEKYKKKLQEGADLRQHVKVCSLEHNHVGHFNDLSFSHWKHKMPISSTRTQRLRRTTARSPHSSHS
jgi:hypothetical protein